MIELTSLGNLTCISIIVGMACVVFKAFSYPISEIAKRLNPFNLSKQISHLGSRIEELDMGKYELQREIRELKKGLTKKPAKRK